MGNKKHFILYQPCAHFMLCYQLYDYISMSVTIPYIQKAISALKMMKSD